MSRVSLLLPAWSALRGAIENTPRLAKRLAQAELLVHPERGRDAQLLRHFEVRPRRLPAAALHRLLDANDAHLNAWLRCDPAHVRADGSLLRLFAVGESLALSEHDAHELLSALRPLFGDSGCPLSAPAPHRWYAAIDRVGQMPDMSTPEQALGEDVLGHLPQGAEGLRWRRLWNESQVILHHHPVNQRRVERGERAVNSLWFWGAGRLPDHVHSKASAVLGNERTLRALAQSAALPVLDAASDEWPAGCLIDLPGVRDVADVEQQVLPDIERHLRSGALGEVHLDFADGVSCVLRPGQSRRFWRRRWSAWPVQGDG